MRRRHANDASLPRRFLTGIVSRPITITVSHTSTRHGVNSAGALDIAAGSTTQSLSAALPMSAHVCHTARHASAASISTWPTAGHAHASPVRCTRTSRTEEAAGGDAQAGAGRANNICTLQQAQGAAEEALLEGCHGEGDGWWVAFSTLIATMY